MRKFNGFTLAEVLITLGIIGVVAAMTMPTLINQTNGAQYKAAYKKALSAISQGVTLNVALEDESFADASPATFLNKRMNVVNTTTGADDNYAIQLKSGTSYAAAAKFGGDNTTLYFNDGSVFSFTNYGTGDKCENLTAKPTNAKCRGLIDVNGAKGPNKEVMDATNPTDVYPVYFYDQTILPATKAATDVLYGK